MISKLSIREINSYKSTTCLEKIILRVENTLSNHAHNVSKVKYKLSKPFRINNIQISKR